MELFILHVWIDNPGAAAQLIFSDRARADAAYNHLAEATLDNCSPRRVSDDFGRQVLLRADKIIGIARNETAKEFEGQQELSFLQAHANAKLQRRAQADPMLRSGIAQPSPFGPNGPTPFQRN